MSPIALTSAPSSSGSAAVLVIGSLELGTAYQARIAQAESEGVERVDKYLIDRIVDGGECSGPGLLAAWVSQAGGRA